jgi:hypothetical protein
MLDGFSPADIMHDIRDTPEQLKQQQKRKKEKKGRNKMNEFEDAFDDTVRMVNLNGRSGGSADRYSDDEDDPSATGA